jgi:plasmid stabilization system protein ParE
MRIRYTPRAQRDLERILEYLREQSPRGDEIVERANRRAIETIAVFPSGGRTSGYRDIRELRAHPYPYIVDRRRRGSAHAPYSSRSARRPGF